jgi:hypothetical protein
MSSLDSNPIYWKYCCIDREYNKFNKYSAKYGIATGYGLDGHGSIPDRAKRFFCSYQHPVWFWDTGSLSPA